MQVGTLLRARGEDKLFIIVGELDILRKKRKSTKKIKGYRIAPLENLEKGFWVTEEQLHERFEEVV